MKNVYDITRTLISGDFIYNNMYSLFPDSVFLDQDFRVMGFSINIQRSIGYRQEELRGKSISCLDDSGGLETRLRQKLLTGYFNNEKIIINKKSGGTVQYLVSGFYLGLLCDCGSVIVLRFINQEEVDHLGRELSETKTQIDNFIYWSAHDLRGPLATILGLVNLLKIRQDDSEVDRFIHMIEAHCKRLDERLSALTYLANNDEAHSPSFELRFSEVEAQLRKMIEKNAFVEFVELMVAAPVEKVLGYNEMHVISMVTNMVHYILSLPKAGTSTVVRINAVEKHGLLTITIHAEGCTPDPDMQRSIENMNTSMYTDLLRSSKYTYLFAAQKIALQHKSLISADVLGDNSLTLCVTIAKQT